MAAMKTVERSMSLRSSLGRNARTGRPAFDWETQRPVGLGEMFPVFAAGVVLAVFATLLCYAKGYTLLYGDAVAHLGIARRITDAHYPGLAQLGGVWLPLPHLLMVPFVQKIAWWQSGLGGAPMNVLSFAASVAAVWRIARRLMSPRWALVATTFYALNPNVLYLASCAMTEPLFLALLTWTTVAVMEGVAAMQAAQITRARRWMIVCGLLIFAMVFTRYDGWVIGAVAWAVFAWKMLQAPPVLRRNLLAAFVLMTLLAVAGPLLWFGYNAKFEGDWLDFMRGPYSAAQIERKTAPPGQHYRGWHNMGWSLLFYTRTAQVDAAWWELGFGVMVASLAGLCRSARAVMPEPAKKKKIIGRVSNVSLRASWLLWVPLPFYVYSIAYGSVPIFIPQLWPHAFYNARYGVELLPAMAIFAALLCDGLVLHLRRNQAAWSRILLRFAGPVAMMLCVVNLIAMAYSIPLVLKEGIVNAQTRVPFEHALAVSLEQMPADEPVMMYTSAHIGALQVAGRPLQTVVSEMDHDAWVKALAHPAESAAYVVAMQGDPVQAAVKAHPQGLKEIEVVETTGQPMTRIYRSTVWTSAAAK
jgi:hypothetical protein